MPAFGAYLGGHADLVEATQKAGLDARLDAAVRRIVDALAAGHPLLVCGNGGSMADALHIAGELAAKFLLDRPGHRVIALGANPATLTAWSNDVAWQSALAREVEAYGEAGGVLLAISTSGNSANVVAAMETARTLGMTTIALTGAGGGRMAPLADILIDLPSRETPRVQELHVIVYHFLCMEVERRLAGQ